MWRDSTRFDRFPHANVNRRDIMERPAPDSQFVGYTGDKIHQHRATGEGGRHHEVYHIRRAGCSQGFDRGCG
ncbi:hypothetical protein, partial [Syntrophothermus sp.]|uniref:hypothetical protein n=1 Tax=Syntrophothermus sp. TaxID=2736299 RepID=UPI00257CEA4A